MTVKRSYLEIRLSLLKRINSSLEIFIPAIAAECGELFHTADRFTRYRIHNKNTSIPLDEKDTERLLFNVRRFVNDAKIIIDNISSQIQTQSVVKMRLLNAKLTLYNSPEERRKK
jgi:hypothetical protein